MTREEAIEIEYLALRDDPVSQVSGCPEYVEGVLRDRATFSVDRLVALGAISLVEK